MSRFKNVVQTKSSSLVDLNTGEVVKHLETKTSAKEVEPNFVKMYIDDIGRLMDMSPSASKVLHALVKCMNYMNMVVMVKGIKELICNELGISINTLNNKISDLTNKGILIRKSKSLYVIDPELFGKGKWENIKKIRMVIDYDTETGKKIINTEMTKQLEIDF